MFILLIYNISGLLIGIAGVAVGVAVFLLTGWLSAGMFAWALVWIALGFWWRSREAAPGVKNRYPALFFIPLPFVAIPLALLAMPLFCVEWFGRGRPPDPRAEQFRADERTLDSAAATGDVALSQSILSKLQALTVEKAKAEQYRVFTRKKGDAILVLLKAPNLKNYSEKARKELLEAIALIVQGEEGGEGKRLFIGIKGQIAFGAIRVPPDKVETGSVLSESKLYDFYNEAPADNTAKSEEK